MKKIIVIGTGGHAKVVIDILNEMNAFEIVGVTSNSLEKNTSFSGYPVIGDDDIIRKFKNNDNYYAAMGLGGYRDNNHRKKVFKYIKECGVSFINAIHPSAIISSSVKLGEGVVIFPGVILNTEVRIGNNTIIATGSTVDHETVIGDHVLISAGVTVGAYSLISEGTLIALGVKIISGIKTGANSVIAAGAVVINDIGENKRVFGVPAKERKESE